MAEDAKREKFKIEIDNEEFNPIGEFKLTTSSELCNLANQIFKNVFADYHGIIFEPGVNGGEPTFSLIFNHGEYPDMDEDGNSVIVGVKSALKDLHVNSKSVVDKMRAQDNLYRNGAKYEATEDLMDVVEKLLVPNLYNSGKPKWGQIVVDFAERTGWGYYGGNNIEQFTKINGISAKRLVSMIYGYKIDDDTYDYDVNVLGTIGGVINGGRANNWVVQISRASLNEVTALYKSFGYNTSTSNIIKA